MNNPVPPPPPNNKKEIPKPPVSKSAIVDVNKYKPLDKGKIPPQAIEMEEAVLGALLIDRVAIEQIEHILNFEMFFREDYSIIYKAIISVRQQKIGIDLLTVSTELKNKGKLGLVGGDYTLISLNQKVSSSAHIEFHARIIIQMYVIRQMIRISSETIETAYSLNPDIFDLMDNARIKIDNIQKFAIKESGVLESVDPESELRRKYENAKNGIESGCKIGISEFDEWCGGLKERELITLAGRTGMGKTTATLAIAGNIAIDKNIDVAFFSLEMSKIDLLNRLASRLSGVSYGKINNPLQLTVGELNEVAKALEYLKTSKIKVYDTMTHKNIYEKIESKIRELAASGVRVFMIDYVQLMKLLNKTTDRTGDLSTITRQLKGLCNELNITIIMLAQVGRGTDSRQGNKVPLLSDLKQSGSIEEDSDMVIFLVREAYYRQESNSTMELPPHVLSDTNFIIAKGRSTGTRTFRTYLDFLTYKIRTYSDVSI